MHGLSKTLESLAIGKNGPRWPEDTGRAFTRENAVLARKVLDRTWQFGDIDNTGCSKLG